MFRLPLILHESALSCWDRPEGFLFIVQPLRTCRFSRAPGSYLLTSSPPSLAPPTVRYLVSVSQVKDGLPHSCSSPLTCKDWGSGWLSLAQGGSLAFRPRDPHSLSLSLLQPAPPSLLITSPVLSPYPTDISSTCVFLPPPLPLFHHPSTHT